MVRLLRHLIAKSLFVDRLAANFIHISIFYTALLGKILCECEYGSISYSKSKFVITAADLTNSEGYPSV